MDNESIQKIENENAQRDKEYRMNGGNTLRNSTLLKILLYNYCIGAMSGNHTNEDEQGKTKHNTKVFFPFQSYEKLFGANVLDEE